MISWNDVCIKYLYWFSFRPLRGKDKEYGVSRGIDFHNVSNVINFDFPTSVDSYIHRVGRCAQNYYSILYYYSIYLCRIFILTLIMHTESLYDVHLFSTMVEKSYLNMI